MGGGKRRHKDIQNISFFFKLIAKCGQKIKLTEKFGKGTRKAVLDLLNPVILIALLQFSKEKK